MKHYVFVIKFKIQYWKSKILEKYLRKSSFFTNVAGSRKESIGKYLSRILLKV